MNKALYIALLLICTFFSAAAQEPKKYIYEDSSLIQDEEIIDAPKVEQVPADEYTTKQYEQSGIDTSLYFRELTTSADTINAIKKDKAFGYINNLDSLLRDEQDKNKKNKPKVQRPKANLSWLDSFFNSGILKIILWTLAICFVLFILYKLFLTKGIFQRNYTKDNAIATVEAEEEISLDTDFDAMIKNALQSNNYRLALRYQYLKSLHNLAGKNIVQMAADKTNYQYVHEIGNADWRNTFASLTLNYEYVWYGEFEIDNVLYEKLASLYKNFNETIG
ncbi:MAG: hypothetical protein IPP48_00650 [Chitinophagaceae bacterium]|nr:hypothetical protein [Chitinophagaceae bacterium]